MVWLPRVDLEREKYKERVSAAHSGNHSLWLHGHPPRGTGCTGWLAEPSRLSHQSLTGWEEEMLRLTLALLVAVPKAAGSQWCWGMWRHLETLSWYLPSSYSRGDQKPTLQGCPGQHPGLKLYQQICVSATVWKRFPPGLPTRHSKSRWVEMVRGVEWLRWLSPIASQQTLNLSNGFTSFKRS